jgi:cold shock CspA family protein
MRMLGIGDAMTGEVVLASKRGFYFIADDADGRQYFLHTSAVVGRTLLRSGDRVKFDIETHPQGRQQARAVNAIKISAAVDIAKDDSHDTTTTAN